MMTLRLWFAVVLGVALFPRPAAAQLFYEFADPTTGVAQTAFSIPTVGGSVQVAIFLRASGTTLTTITGQGGYGSAAVRLNFNNPAGIAAVPNLGSIVAGPAWSFSTTNGTNLPGGFAVLNLTSDLVTGVSPDGAGRIRLGTFTLTGSAAGVTTLGALDPNAQPGDVTTLTLGTNLDSATAGSATLSVAPEPGCVFACAAGVALLAAWRRRRGAGATGYDHRVLSRA